MWVYFFSISSFRAVRRHPALVENENRVFMVFAAIFVPLSVVFFTPSYTIVNPSSKNFLLFINPSETPFVIKFKLVLKLDDDSLHTPCAIFLPNAFPVPRTLRPFRTVSFGKTFPKPLISSRSNRLISFPSLVIPMALLHHLYWIFLHGVNHRHNISQLLIYPSHPSRPSRLLSPWNRKSRAFYLPHLDFLVRIFDLRFDLN